MLWLWVSAKERYHCHDNDDCGCCVDDIELIRKKGGSQKERKNSNNTTDVRLDFYLDCHIS